MQTAWALKSCALDGNWHKYHHDKCCGRTKFIETESKHVEQHVGRLFP
jgi:hypothetical protein